MLDGDYDVIWRQEAGLGKRLTRAERGWRRSGVAPPGLPDSWPTI